MKAPYLVTLCTALVVGAALILTPATAVDISKEKALINDSLLTAKPKIALAADARVKRRRIDVETTQGLVVLRGRVDSDAAKHAVEGITAGLDVIKSVQNDLQVVAPSTRGTEFLAMATSPAPPRSPKPTAGRQSAREGRHLDTQQAERLKAVMTPLLQKMNHPIPLDRVRIALMDDSHINAANAGGGEFYVTTGLLQRANDEQLAGVLAHEVAHADLGHVTKLQTIGAGTNIAAVLLNAFGVPGAGFVPLAGDLLIARPYGRDAEYAADRHGADLLQRTGRDGKQIMATTLTWLMQAEGSGDGGFFATHPATDDRIQRVQE